MCPCHRQRQLILLLQEVNLIQGPAAGDEQEQPGTAEDAQDESSEDECKCDCSGCSSVCASG